MGANQDLLARRERVVPRGVPRATTATAVSAHDATIIDAEGRELIDFVGGIGTMNGGHTQDEVVRAISEQAARLQHVCIHVATYEPYVALCEKLAQLLPHGERTKVLLLNSGAEAVENAIKIARQATGRPAVICYSEAFHGRTLLGMTLTSKVGYKAGCGPFAPDIHRLPFPNRYHYGHGLDEDEFVEREVTRLEEAFLNTVSADDVAAILLEPVQGEGGFVPAPAGYLRALRRICDERGIILIFDEILSGFGRAGGWAAYERYDVTPDLSTWAKSMGGGLPVSAVIGRADVMDAARPGTIGGTFGGNPVACASALATIRLMEERDIPGRAREIGAIVRDRFELLAERCPAIGDVRGLGAMIGVEFVEGGDPGRPAGAKLKAVLERCLERGVLMLSAGTHGNVLRILSPLVITNDLLDRGLSIVEEVVLDVFGTESVEQALASAAAG
jgi:4-aminobutyrate aminotransferase/(S)-3-amino-2-methylpropionate transaminase